MPSIIETIREYDEDILAMIAEEWGIDLQLKPGKDIPDQIAELISQPAMMAEIFSSLAKKPAAALKALATPKGRMAWDQFAREFGDLREMGAARRERERPDRSPASISEMLFYKAMIGRGFFKTRQGLREFAYIPDEFLEFFRSKPDQNDPEGFNLIPDAKIEKKLLSNDHIIDLACTVIAGLRIGLSINDLESFMVEIPGAFLFDLLKETGLITKRMDPSLESVKNFLEAPRGSALAHLTRAWMASLEIDELDLIESLTFEGKRDHNPLASRKLLIQIINSIPEDTWVTLDDFCARIFREQPDILRSGGEYDAWFVKNRDGGAYVRGFENWDFVDGAYIRMMLLKPLFWLGLVDLGKGRGDSKPTTFRKSRWFSALASGSDLVYPTLKRKDFEVEKSGQIIIDRFFPREIRYQVARCCEWEGNRGHKFFYRITTQGLTRMEKQGLKISLLESLIKRYARKPLPVNILAALERWGRHGQEAEIGRITVVRVRSAQIMDKLMASPAQEYILNRLNATTAEITAASAPNIRAALLEMGVLTQILPEV